MYEIIDSYFTVYGLNFYLIIVLESQPLEIMPKIRSSKPVFFDSSKKTKDLYTKACDIRCPENIGINLRNIIRVTLLIVSDLFAIFLGFYIVNHDRLQVFLLPTTRLHTDIKLLCLPTLLLGISFLSANKLYTTKEINPRLSDVIKSITLAYLALTPITWELYGRNYLWQLLLAYLITALLISSWRLITFYLLNRYQQYFSDKLKVILLGEKNDIEQCFPLLTKSKTVEVSNLLNLSEFETHDSILAAIKKLDLNKIDEILICSWGTIKKSPKIYWKLRYSGIKWQIIQLNPADSQLNTDNYHITGISTIKVHNQTIKRFDFLIKRIFDIVASLLLLTVLSVPMMAIALLIRLDSPGSVFYKQTRVGLNGNYFDVWKFRTMVPNASQLQQQLEAKNEISGGVLFKIKDDPRITRLGKYLRQYSLDELPQLFNVLRGEMSLVGPRPLPVRDVERFAPEHHDRHEVLPGITGLWQISGRSDTDSENVFNLDFEYIQNWSLALDLKILWRTVGVVLNSKGAY